MSWQGHSGSLGPSRGPQSLHGFHDAGRTIGPTDRGTFHPSGHHAATLMDRNGLGDRMLGPNWAHHEGPQVHHPWDHHFDNHHWYHHWDYFHHHFAFYPFPFFFWPFWDYPWYRGFARPYVYTYVYCYDFSPYDVFVYADAPPAPEPASLTAEQTGPRSPTTAADDTGLNALEFYSAAREEFRKGDYRKALRLAGHAAVEAPENAKVHELTSLALMALGDYRGAAIEAHAVMAFGPVSDWNTLFGYYNDAPKYTKQLRALEDHVKAHPSSAEGHFLLGYQYLMIGARDDAKTHFAEAAKLTPKDRLAAYVLQQLEAGKPVTPPPPKPSGAK